MKIGRIVVLVHDYDQAIDFYSETLGFEMIVDFTEAGQRFVHLSLPGDDVGIWFIRPDGLAKEQVGKQCLSEPLLVLYTREFEQVYKRLREKEVEIRIHPADSPHGKFLHFYDLYGNELVLVDSESL